MQAIVNNNTQDTITKSSLMKRTRSSILFLVVALASTILHSCDAFAPIQGNASPKTDLVVAGPARYAPSLDSTTTVTATIMGTWTLSNILLFPIHSARAAAEDLEYAELPPPYVPALFGIGLLVGVGLLTSSLGNVMDEEASLGMQSGARARKEIERSRSSFFRKK